MFLIHLNRKGMSRRAVRIEPLTSTEIDENEKNEAANITETTKNAEFNAAVAALGMRRMIQAVSEPTNEPKTAKFEDVSLAVLVQNWGKWFNAKDSALLRAIYLQEHTVTNEDLEAITSGKVELASED
jgi:hypothetical protein